MQLIRHVSACAGSTLTLCDVSQPGVHDKKGRKNVAFIILGFFKVHGHKFESLELLRSAIKNLSSMYTLILAMCIILALYSRT